MSAERQEQYTDEPTANLLARLEEIAAECERRAGGLGFADAYEAVRDSLALREIAHRLVEATLALRSAREDSARLQHAVDRHRFSGLKIFAPFGVSDEYEILAGVHRIGGGKTFDDAVRSLTLPSAVSLPQPERDDDGN